jgi:hypothetical protein
MLQPVVRTDRVVSVWLLPGARVWETYGDRSTWVVVADGCRRYVMGPMVCVFLLVATSGFCEGAQSLVVAGSVFAATACCGAAIVQARGV